MKQIHHYCVSFLVLLQNILAISGLCWLTVLVVSVCYRLPPSFRCMVMPSILVGTLGEGRVPHGQVWEKRELKNGWCHPSDSMPLETYIPLPGPTSSQFCLPHPTPSSASGLEIARPLGEHLTTKLERITSQFLLLVLLLICSSTTR